jgi:hypothetical protein
MEVSKCRFFTFKSTETKLVSVLTVPLVFASLVLEGRVAPVVEVSEVSAVGLFFIKKI